MGRNGKYTNTIYIPFIFLFFSWTSFLAASFYIIRINITVDLAQIQSLILIEFKQIRLFFYNGWGILLPFSQILSVDLLEPLTGTLDRCI